jgi:hypothetical protein
MADDAGINAANADEDPYEGRLTRGVPPARVRVEAGSTLTHPTDANPEGEVFGEGDELVIEGPLAQQLAMQGHVTIIEEDAS